MTSVALQSISPDDRLSVRVEAWHRTRVVDCLVRRDLHVGPQVVARNRGYPLGGRLDIAYPAAPFAREGAVAAVQSGRHAGALIAAAAAPDAVRPQRRGVHDRSPRVRAAFARGRA